MPFHREAALRSGLGLLGPLAVCFVHVTKSGSYFLLWPCRAVMRIKSVPGT